MQEAASSSRRNTARMGMVLLLVMLASLRRFWNGVVWDDQQLLDLTKHMLEQGRVLSAFAHSTLGQVLERSGDAAASDLDLYRPMSLLSFAANYAIAGEQPFFYHLTNLALHLGCVCLVYLLACELLAEERRAFAPLAAAWFGVTPHLAEAHVWISGRFDEVCSVFGLLALLLFVRAGRALSVARRGMLLGMAALCFLLGLFGKEALVFALPAFAFVPGMPARGLRQRALRLAPLLGALLVYAALRTHALHGSGAGITTLANVLQALAHWPLVVWDAASSLLFPSRVYSRLLVEDYAGFGASRLGLAAIGFGLIAALALRARRELPVFAWSLFWLTCTLLPVALISTRAWPGFGRFLYLPGSMFCVGVVELCAFGYQRWPRYAAIARVLLAAHVLVLALRLHIYATDFQSDDTLFTSIIEAAPEQSHGYGFLGITYLERRRYADAVVLLQKADQLAPFERRYMQTLGQALLFSGRNEQALALAQRGIGHWPSAPEFHLLAAYAVLAQDPSRAAREVLACLRDMLDNSECRDALGFLVQKHPQAAIFRQQFAMLAQELPARDAPLRALVRAKLAAH